MDDYSAYQSAELAELYDATYADCGDTAFWLEIAAGAGAGPLLELASGTGRLLLPLARAGYDITGIDQAAHMLARCRAKLQEEAQEVRDRVTLVEADMTAFELHRRYALVFCAFNSFHHLRTVDEQLGCLEASRRHLLPGGTLVLDLVNPDPAPPAAADTPAAPAPVAGPAAEPAADASTASADWTNGRRVRAWARTIGTERSLQCNDVEVTYEVTEADGTTRQLAETFPMRVIYRYELEHLLARCGFRIVALYGDYDCSAFSDESPGMIVVARPLDD